MNKTLENYRKHRNLSIERLAHEIGITTNYLRMLINEEANPTLEVCVKINNATGIKIIVDEGKVIYG